MVKHGLRNALIPVLTVTSLQIGFLLVGTVLVETRWVWAAWVRSSPMPSRTVTTRSSRRPCCSSPSRSRSSTSLTDLLYAVIDPRIRYA